MVFCRPMKKEQKNNALDIIIKILLIIGAAAAIFYLIKYLKKKCGPCLSCCNNDSMCTDGDDLSKSCGDDNANADGCGCGCADDECFCCEDECDGADCVDSGNENAD